MSAMRILLAGLYALMNPRWMPVINHSVPNFEQPSRGKHYPRAHAFSLVRAVKRAAAKRRNQRRGRK